jgi:hypothetical protein
MKTTHHDEKLELLIGRDLAWMHGQHARRLGELVA